MGTLRVSELKGTCDWDTDEAEKGQISRMSTYTVYVHSRMVKTSIVTGNSALKDIRVEALQLTDNGRGPRSDKSYLH